MFYIKVGFYVFNPWDPCIVMGLLPFKIWVVVSVLYILYYMHKKRNSNLAFKEKKQEKKRKDDDDKLVLLIVHSFQLELILLIYSFFFISLNK